MAKKFKSQANKKLKNLETVKKMVSGTHRSQTKTKVGYESDKTIVKREIGDTWVDEKGVEWIQKDGYKMKKGKLQDVRDYLFSFPNCPKEKCTCNSPKRNDHKMKKLHGKCFDCVIDMEHDHRVNGTFEEYERKKVVDNAKAWLVQAKKELDVVLRAVEAKSFVNQDGTVEEWTGGLTVEEMKDKIEADFTEFKLQFLGKLGVTEAELGETNERISKEDNE